MANRLQTRVILIFDTKCTIRYAWQCTSNTSGNRLHTLELFSMVLLNLDLTMNIQSSLVTKRLHIAENLSTISAVMFATIKYMEFFITFKACYCCLIFDPFLFGTQRSLYYFTNFIVHLQQL